MCWREGGWGEGGEGEKGGERLGREGGERGGRESQKKKKKKKNLHKIGAFLFAFCFLLKDESFGEGIRVQLSWFNHYLP